MPESEFFDKIPLGIAVFRQDAEGYRVLRCNEELRARTGRSCGDIAAALNGEPGALVHPADADRLALMLYKSGVAGGRFGETLRLRLKDGGYSWTDVRLNAEPADDGSCLCCFTFTDVDKQKERELKLERTYEELLGVMNNTPGGIVVFNTRNNREPFPVFVSPGVYRLLRGTPSQIAALYENDCLSAVHPLDREAAVRAMEEALRDLAPFQLSLRLRTAPGDYVWVDANGTAGAAEGMRSLYMSFTYSSADRETQRLLKRILDLFSRSQYDNICVVNGADRSYRIVSIRQNEEYEIPEQGGDYYPAVCGIIRHFVEPDDQAPLLEALRFENLRARLEAEGETEIFFGVRFQDGSERYKKLWICWLDRDAGQFAFVLSDYTELHRHQLSQQSTLVDALRAAEQANKAKSVFLSRMSHDIRTPLNAIIGFTKMGLDDAGNSSAEADRLQKVEAASEYLLSLVNDVLDMSRIESGKFTLRSEAFRLPALLEDVKAVIGPQCAARRQRFLCETAAGVGETYVGDSLKLQQVLVNLLGNSVKFTPEGGEISLRVFEDGVYGRLAMLRFVVSDNGVGISPEFLPHIFETFSQEGGEKTTQLGTGLGLAICKSLIGLMNGDIRVRSVKGGGSEFTVEVQLGTAEDQTAPAFSARGEAGSVLERRLRGKRVLLAEDNPMNQEIARYMLESAGIETDVAENGLEALNRFEASAPGYYDAVLLDIRMPVMDGTQAAAGLRALARADARTVPIIAVSADAFDEDIKKSLSSGIDAHLIKPLDRGALYRTLDGLWQASETL